MIRQIQFLSQQPTADSCLEECVGMLVAQVDSAGNTSRLKHSINSCVSHVTLA